MRILLINKPRLRHPHLRQQADRRDAHLRRVLHGGLREAGGFFDELRQEIVVVALVWLHELVLVVHLNEWPHLIYAVEVVNHIRIQRIELIHIDHVHLLAAVCEVAERRDEFFRQIRVLLVSVVDCIEAIVFAEEPLHGQLHHFDIATQVLGHGDQRLHAQLGHFEVLAVAARRDGLQHFLEVLLCCFYQFRVLGSERILNLRLQHHRQMPTILVNIIVPIDHGFVSAFDSFDNAMRQELIVVGQQCGRLLWLHCQGAAQRV